MLTRPSRTLLSANLTTTPSCSSRYRQKLKQEVPVLHTIQHWSGQSKSTLQDCFDHEDWDMFRVACENNLDAYTDMVTEFIRKCIGDVVPTVTIKTYYNQKPWIDGSIRAKLNARTTAFNHLPATSPRPTSCFGQAKHILCTL